MSEAEKMILSDAIQTSIETEKENIKLKRENKWVNGMNFLLILMVITCLITLIWRL